MISSFNMPKISKIIIFGIITFNMSIKNNFNLQSNKKEELVEHHLKMLLKNVLVKISKILFLSLMVKLVIIMYNNVINY